MIGLKHELEEKNPRASSQAPKGTLDLIKHDDYLTYNSMAQYCKPAVVQNLSFILDNIFWHSHCTSHVNFLFLLENTCKFITSIYACHYFSITIYFLNVETYI